MNSVQRNRLDSCHLKALREIPTADTSGEAAEQERSLAAYHRYRKEVPDRRQSRPGFTFPERSRPEGPQAPSTEGEAERDSLVHTLGQTTLTLGGGQQAQAKFVVIWKQQAGEWLWDVAIWNDGV